MAEGGILGLSGLEGRLASLGDKAEKAIEKTKSDFKTRAPAWVGAAVSEEYGIKKADVKAALKGKSKDALTYSGRLLTPTHFKMKPAAVPAKREKKPRLIPGENVKSDTPGAVATVSPPASYKVSAEIKRGKRKTLPSSVFLGKGGGESAIPFQRKGESRFPVESIKTVSVPQMITNEEVSDSIREKVAEGLHKRLEHHIEQELKKM